MSDDFIRAAIPEAVWVETTHGAHGLVIEAKLRRDDQRVRVFKSEVPAGGDVMAAVDDLRRRAADQGFLSEWGRW